MNLIRLETIVCLGVIAVGCRFALRSWWNPGSVLAGVFILSLGMQHLLIPGVLFGPVAAITVLGGSLAAAIGSLLAKKSSHEPTDTLVEVIPNRLRLCDSAIWAFVGIAIWYTYLVYSAVIVQKSSYVNGVFYREDFALTVGSGFPFRLGQSAMYIGVVLLALDVLARGLRRPAPLLFIGCLALQAYILSTKALVLVSLILFVTVWASARQASLKRLVTGRNVLVFSLLLVAALGISTAVTDRRSQGTVSVGATIAYSYGGPPSALSYVLDNGFDPGTRRGDLFGGILELAGGRERGNGQGLVPVQLANDTYPSNINVYTWYLVLLHDLGPVGMVAALVLIAYLAASLSRRVSGADGKIAGLIVLALFMSLLVWAPITSLTYFNVWFVLLALAPGFGQLYRIGASDPDLEAVEPDPLTSAMPLARIPAHPHDLY